MGLRAIVIAGLALLRFAVVPVYADIQPPSEQLSLTSALAATWTEDRVNVVLLRGPVHIALDGATLDADAAVVWLTPADQENLDILNVQIALIGHARLTQGASTRSGERLLVSGQARGQGIRILADERVARDDSKSELYQSAKAMRAADRAEPLAATEPSTAPSGAATRRATTRPGFATFEGPIVFEAQNIETLNGPDGKIQIILTGGVRLAQKRPNLDFIELSADRAVLFTALNSMKELSESNGKKHGRESVVGAYLEGDVRIEFVGARPGMPEQRLTADRAYYEFATDRAVLTDAIVHTNDPQRQLPVVMRARMVRQLSQGEFATENVRLSTSSFAVPSYSLAAEKLYLRDEPSGDPRIGDQVYFVAKNTTFEAFDVPFFFLPQSSGELSRGMALRGIGVGNSHDFGAFFTSEWGLFETLGKVPPRDLDVDYRLDYFSKRGPGFGVNAAYGGGLINDTTKQPFDFEGDFKSYFVYDHGEDTLGDVYRLPVRDNEPYSPRGQVLWEHQHYFPDNWSAQARLGYVSDPTFMEEWFREDFENGPPRDVMGYIKHQEGTEAFYFGGVWQPDRYVTTSNYQQEQFEVDRLPQIGYESLGDGLFNDNVTLFSENNAGGEHFALSRASLKAQGFQPPLISPGIPAEGYTGTTNNIVWRGDLRQELDFPFTAGPMRVTPYVMGRFTQYSDSPQNDASRSRGMVGMGTRLTTELWKVDPAAESDLFDIHQIRHVIEPEINLFTSAMNVNRGQVFVFDQDVDAINDISAAQFAIHQRWQTKRGGPGEWRSVDAFTLNVSVDTFENKPLTKYINPYDFRGLFFASYPEESMPRDAVNADASWRLSDNTILLGDTSFNLDRGNLQTLALGVLIRRDNHLSYFVGNRYIADLNSNITSVHVDYELTSKYSLDLDQEFDFTQGKNVFSSIAILRHFDTFIIAVRYFTDETTNESAFSFNIIPVGLGYGVDTSSFNTFHR